MGRAPAPQGAVNPWTEPATPCSVDGSGTSSPSPCARCARRWLNTPTGTRSAVTMPRTPCSWRPGQQLLGRQLQGVLGIVTAERVPVGVFNHRRAHRAHGLGDDVPLPSTLQGVAGSVHGLTAPCLLSTSDAADD